MVRIQRWQYHANDNTYGIADHGDVRVPRSPCGLELFNQLGLFISGLLWERKLNFFFLQVMVLQGLFVTVI